MWITKLFDQNKKDKGDITNDDCLHVLSPIILTKTNPAYYSVEELRKAVNDNNCRNIAITGVYGAGKSSVINTFLSEDRVKKVLKISLSNFIPESIEGHGMTKQLKAKKYESDIEYRIFLQILHKSNQGKTAKTHYERLSYISMTKAVRFAVLTCLFFISIIVAFEPNIFRIDSIHDWFYHLSNAGNIKFWIDLVAVFFMISYIVGYTIYVIKRFNSTFLNNLKKVKASGIEFDIESNSSTINKLLNEILYFLKAGKYELVIFEDLDRIINPQDLFLKFREINLLLNESDYFTNRKKVKFLYAIRDDVFCQAVRTKCFDYIIPIVPVVDSNNAGDYLINKCLSVFGNDGKLDELSKKDLLTLGSHIDGMRELTNITNEYKLYRNAILTNEKSWKKLLAMTIYKNKYPLDYSKLYRKSGCLYSIFQEKSKFEDLLTKAYDEKIETFNNELDKINQSIFLCRRKVLDVMFDDYSIVALVIEDQEYPLEKVEKSDRLFNSLMKNEVEKAIINDDHFEAVNYTYNYKDILARIDTDSEFMETLNEAIGRRDELRKSIEAHQKSIEIIKRNKLQTLILNINDGEKTLEIVSQIVEESYKLPYDSKNYDDNNIGNFLHFMIRNGYIAEDYSSYTSYSYPGAMTEDDQRFFDSVLQGVPTYYTTKINNIAAIVGALRYDHYANRSILNFSLLIYLLNSAKDNFVFERFIQTARENPDFIVAYSKEENFDKHFMDKVFGSWNGCLEIIKNIENNEIGTDMMILWLQYAPSTLKLTREELALLNDKYQFICSHIRKLDFKKISTLIKCYKLKFKKLVAYTNETKVLFDFIIQGCYFVVNYDSLSLIFNDKFKLKPYSIISRSDLSLKSYITKDINKLISQFPDTAKNEDASCFLELFNNEKIDSSILEVYLKQQEMNFVDLSEIPVKYISMVVKNDKILPIWNNIEKCITCNCDMQVVIDYIYRHRNNFAGLMADDNNKIVQLQLLANNDRLSDDLYIQLSHCFNTPFEASEITEVNTTRLEVLLDNNLVIYDKDTKVLFAKDSRLHAKYIIRFFDEFYKDEVEDEELTNKTSIYLLKSDLPLAHKQRLLDNYIILNDDENKNILCQLVCFYYNELSDIKDIYLDLAVDALTGYQSEDSWAVKISLINKINKQYLFDEGREKIMLASLGRAYTELLEYSHKPTSLYKNDQNIELVEYINLHTPYISTISIDSDPIKIYYHHDAKQ